MSLLHTSAKQSTCGGEQNLDLVWGLDGHTTVQIIAAYYEVEPYLRQTPPAGRNATDFSAKMNYRSGAIRRNALP